MKRPSFSRVARAHVASSLFALAFAGPAHGALVVSATSPATNAGNVAPTSPIRVDFAQPVLTTSFVPNDFSVFGRASGVVGGTFSFGNANRTVTFTPARSLIAGESVNVVLSENLRAADGTTLRTEGYAFSFVVRTRPASRVFTQIASLSNRTLPNFFTQIYGANSVDLNSDGYPDLTSVNENSADLRVFMNRADGTGLYRPFLQPPFPIGDQSSPNDSADFNRDGKVDLAVSATIPGEVWVVFGNGNGTFGASQAIPVGSQPHGVAVLDADGDGDSDIAVSVCGSDYVALVLNNGNGVFGSPITFEAGGVCEYGLTAADMNNDHIMDLVVGLRGNATVGVLRGNGNATFSPIALEEAGGLVWVVAAGDVNGDGNMDVSTANSTSGNGAILLGNGAGALAPPVTYSTGGHTPSTDLGDLDGDGDLDWVLSSYGSHLWRVFSNDGQGNFRFDQDITADVSPSCSILVDFDRDGDLDIALTDEIADTIRLMRNGSAQAAGVPATTPGSLAALFVAFALAGLRQRRNGRAGFMRPGSRPSNPQAAFGNPST